MVFPILGACKLVTWTLCIINSISSEEALILEFLILNFLLRSMQIIMLSASANRLSRLKEQAEEYAALIMEELDPERLGYIEVGPF